jgi:methylated-DNA-[protein]-cysteine S-methyltransferase
MPQLSFHTPLGALTLSEEDGAIVALDWGFGRDQTQTPLLCRGRDQLQAYMDGARTTFDLPLAPRGTAYCQRVWQALLDIPYGQTASYGALAGKIGGSARSIGGANSRNPIPIVIPCHRVVASTGLGGYSGGEGLETKSWLLALEQGAATQARAERR